MCQHRQDPAPLPVSHDRARGAPHDASMGRRRFLELSGGCAAHLALAGGAAPVGASTFFAASGPRRVVQEVPWGRLEEVAEGVWALVSTPLRDRTTLCNGGIVSGNAGVLMVEAFGSPEGATWMARQARALTGRWPDQVLLTHFHGDHTGGLPGVSGEEGGQPSVRATATTRELTRWTARTREDAALLGALDGVTLIPGVEPGEMDLGGRVVEVLPREGHTASDVTVELRDPPVVFCGDLVWNRFFPNYVDAVPSLLTPSVRALRREGGPVYVPGHGPLADAGDLDLYLSLLELVEAHARSAVDRGLSAREAAGEFALPEPLRDWYFFSDQYAERALGAWMAELRMG